MNVKIDPLTAEEIKEAPPAQNVCVVDVKIPFGSMVVLLVKWAIAAIPAAVILVVPAAVVLGVFRAMLSP